MIHASVRMKFVSGKFSEARDILLALVEPTQVAPGCLGCGIYKCLREQYVLLFEQWWETQDDLDQYLRSDPYNRVIVAMEHTTRDGKPKILKKCTLPLTGAGVVDTIVTDLAVIEVTPEGLTLAEISPDTTVEAVQNATEAALSVSSTLKKISV